MVERIAALAREIEQTIPGVTVDFTAFPSGAAMLDVRRGGHLYVLSYSPTLHFGVDEVFDGEGFLTGYRFACEEFEPAAAQLCKLVAGAEAA
jgi:hypothetical protein